MDLEYVCTDNYPEMMTVSLPVLMGFSLLVPAIVVALVRCRCENVSDETWQYLEDAMSFLYKGLKDEHKYWEAVNLIRKGMQAAVVTVLSPFGVETQLICMVCVVGASWLLQAMYHPYQL